jgi:hypothetical protein
LDRILWQFPGIQMFTRYVICLITWLLNLWHACRKWHAKRIPWHAVFTDVPIFLFLLPDQRLYIVKNIVYIQIFYCVETSYTNCRCYQIILQVKLFYTNRERWEVLTEYLQMGRHLNGDWANTRHWAKHLTIFFLKNRSSSSPSYVHFFFLFACVQEAFVRNVIILVCINYTISILYS